MLKFACLFGLAVLLVVHGEGLHGTERPAHLLRDSDSKWGLGFSERAEEED